MDPDKLPPSALIDTTVLIRGLGERKEEPSAGDCRDFLAAMVEAKRPVLIAAPSFAELLRKQTTEKPPVMSGILVVAFDQIAAKGLGRDFPKHTLVQLRNDHSGATMDYYKYDAMIVATAVRWNAGTIVALDAGLLKLARHVGLRAAYPGDFRRAQASFPIVEEAVELAMRKR